MADRIVVMNHGVIEQVGTPTEIYREPATLFVADFIGETNQIAARAAGRDSLAFGPEQLGSAAHGLPVGTPVTAVIRPEDVIPHAPGFRDGPDTRNIRDVTIAEMEFLGSFWRARLIGARLGREALVADFSINAVRRLSLTEGMRMTVELPAARLLAYPGGEADDRGG